MNELKRQFEKQHMENTLRHAYLFTGVDALNFAVWLSQKIICGCNNTGCITCNRIVNSNHPDVFMIEPDGQYIKVDQIRELLNQGSLKSYEGNGQVFIIRQAEKMNPQAANALLKFLEEPKPNVNILMTSNNKELLLETIISRVQTFNVGSTVVSSIATELGAMNIQVSTAAILSEFTSELALFNECEDKVDQWIEQVKALFQLPEAQALISVQTWDKLYENKDQKLFSCKLLQSYGKALLAHKKGDATAWGSLPSMDWQRIVTINKAINDFSKNVHSNGHYISQLEMLIRNK